ncbi:MAG: hypothetical protein JWP34_3204 [Massilia sp.]|nr:hypothetical protein [Massilia sp.]
MLGKYDSPYKRATAMMDPVANSIGDYNTIMGNTGGDAVTEFDPRTDAGGIIPGTTIKALSVEMQYAF